MLGTIICWMFALVLALTKANGLDDWYTKLLFAMGFILLAILNKAVEAYHEVHMSDVEETTENKNT